MLSEHSRTQGIDELVQASQNGTVFGAVLFRIGCLFAATFASDLSTRVTVFAPHNVTSMGCMVDMLCELKCLWHIIRFHDVSCRRAKSKKECRCWTCSKWIC